MKVQRFVLLHEYCCSVVSSLQQQHWAHGSWAALLSVSEEEIWRHLLLNICCTDLMEVTSTPSKEVTRLLYYSSLMVFFNRAQCNGWLHFILPFLHENWLLHFEKSSCRHLSCMHSVQGWVSDAHRTYLVIWGNPNVSASSSFSPKQPFLVCICTQWDHYLHGPLIHIMNCLQRGKKRKYRMNHEDVVWCVFTIGGKVYKWPCGSHALRNNAIYNMQLLFVLTCFQLLNVLLLWIGINLDRYCHIRYAHRLRWTHLRSCG